MFLDSIMKFFSSGSNQQAAQKPQTINEEAGLGPEWQAVDTAPIIPSQMVQKGAADGSTKYLQGSVGPAFQHDATFVETAYRSPNAPQLSLMPMGPSGLAQNNAAIQSIINENNSTTNITSTGLNWRGDWNSFTKYSVNDVVQFNISTYIAIKANSNQEPDSNTSSWTLVSKNFNFRGKFAIPSFIQAARGNSGIFGPIPTTATFAAPNSQGNLIFAYFLSFDYFVGEAFTISDSQGNTYSAVTNVSIPAQNAYLFVASNIKSGTNAITVQGSGTNPAGSGVLLIFEFAGVSAVDASGHNTSTSGTSLGVSVTTNHADELLVLFNNNFPTNSFSVTTPPGGFAVIFDTGTGGNQAQVSFDTIIPATTATYTVNYSFATSGNGASLIAASLISGGTTTYFPSDVVEYLGSMYVCVSKTTNSPLASPSSWVLLAQGTGNVSAKTADYTAIDSDYGSLISFNSAGAHTLTLPSPPPEVSWWIGVENINTGALTISRNGLTIDGAAANITLNQNQGILIFTDGTNYFTMRGFGTVTSFSAGNLTPLFTTTVATPTTTPALSFAQIVQNANLVFAGPSSGAAANPTFRALVGADIPAGVNSQTTNYSALATDTGKLISFSSGSAVTLTLPNPAPSANYVIEVENVGAGTLTISRNSLLIDGASTNLTLTTNQGVVIYSDGTNYFTQRGMGSSGSSVGGVNSQTTNYTALSGDNGKLITFNSASGVTLTLPASPPSSTWLIFVEDVGAGGLTVSRNGLLIDGAASNVSLTQNQGIIIFTDGTNYFTSRGMGSGGGGGSAGGVNAQTSNYTAVSGDNGKLVTFNSASAVTLTLPASPPSATWWISVEDVGAGLLTVNPNGLTLDGSGNSILIPQNQGIVIFTDGTNYFTERGLGGGLIAKVDLSGQTGAIGATNFSNTGTGLQAGMYAVYGFVDVTTAATSGSLTVTINYTTDSGADSQTTSAIGVGSLGSNGGFVIPFFSTANNVVSYQTNFISVVGTPTYTLHLWLVAVPGTPISASFGGVNSQTANYTLVIGDAGKLVTFNGSNLTATLPSSPPSSTWYAAIENRNSTILIISRNGLNIDGAASNIFLSVNQGVVIYTDGSNYFTQRGMGNSTIAQSPGADTISATATFATVVNIPANTAQVGDVFEIWVDGKETITSGHPWTYNLALGATAVSPGTGFSLNAVSNQQWKIYGQIVVLATGVSGSVLCTIGVGQQDGLPADTNAISGTFQAAIPLWTYLRVYELRTTIDFTSSQNIGINGNGGGGGASSQLLVMIVKKR